MSTSSAILDNWEDGIHYCGDIDDLIDSIYEENECYYKLLEVVEEFYPDVEDLGDWVDCWIMKLEELNGNKG